MLLTKDQHSASPSAEYPSRFACSDFLGGLYEVLALGRHSTAHVIRLSFVLKVRCRDAAPSRFYAH